MFPPFLWFSCLCLLIKIFYFRIFLFNYGLNTLSPLAFSTLFFPSYNSRLSVLLCSFLCYDLNGLSSPESFFYIAFVFTSFRLCLTSPRFIPSCVLPSLMFLPFPRLEHLPSITLPLRLLYFSFIFSFLWLYRFLFSHVLALPLYSFHPEDVNSLPSLPVSSLP